MYRTTFSVILDNAANPSNYRIFVFFSKPLLYVCAPPGGLDQQHLNIPDGALAESAFAVAEVELPGADEFIVESETFDPVDFTVETHPPMRKGFRIV